MSGFHFLRPWFLCILVPLGVVLLLLWQHRLSSQSWRKVVDPALLPHLLLGADRQASAWPLLGLGIWFLVATVALAGPAWRKVEQPVFRSTSALVIVLDLSRSMDAEDVVPSRLERVKLKLLDILASRQEGQTGLVVYAGHPFVVSPLTEDRATIGLQVKTLTTDLMPAQGSRPDRALDQAVDLLKQTGVARGEVLLLTDSIAAGDPEQIGSRILPHRLSVLGIGTTDGAPVPSGGQGFLKDSTGAIVLARLQEDELKTLAHSGGGRYHRLTSDDRDIHFLLPSLQPSAGEEAGEDAGRTDQWRDEGPWLVLLLLPFAALLFRRGIFILPFCLVLSQATPSHAFDWKDVWLRKDQQGARAMKEGVPATAAELFTDQQWRAAAQYRAGNYQDVLELQQGDSSDALYNRGNALARLGRLEEARQAYDQAIEKDPANEDAIYNRDLVQEQLDRQQHQQQQSQQQQQDDQGDQGDQGQEQGQAEQGEDASNQPESGDGMQEREAGQEERDRAEEAQPEESPRDGEQQERSAEAGKAEGQEVNSGKPEAEGDDSDPEARQSTAAEMEQQEQSAERQEIEKQLRAIPDDPGGLWRRKFKYQYDQQYRQQGEERQQW